MSETRAQRKERRSRYDDGFRVLQGNREFVTYPEDASLRMWFSDIPWRYDSHQHSAVEVLLTLEGFVDYQVQEQTYRVQKDEVLIVPSELPHALNMGPDSSRMLFLFEPAPMMEMRDYKRLKESFERVFYLHDESDTHVRIRELLKQIIETYQERELMWNTQCYSRLLEIYALLGQRYLAGLVARPGEEESAMDREVISSAMNYIDGHFQQKLTLDEVADFTGFSRYYFSRSFKQQTGFSFKEYLCQRRIQNAMELLIHTSRPMHEVATESGFSSVATFNRSFREHKNCTPTQYRAIYGTF